MLIQIHMIQHHSPANLNRDDLGAPKTCYFGGVLRSRISSQCIKRSIRMSSQFQKLLGGIRTRRLVQLVAKKAGDTPEIYERVQTIFESLGLESKKSKKDEASTDGEQSKMLVFTTRQAVEDMVALLKSAGRQDDKDLVAKFGDLISKSVAVPDMALCGRMLETSGGIIKDTTVEAALQVAHAISTHEARPEVDYYVAADDIPGDDAGAAYVDEALFASACFYKYFSINWELLVANLHENAELAAHTVGAWLRGAALTSPTGKQNSFAAHNPPDGILVDLSDTPISYANAFAQPVTRGERDIVSQSIAQLAQYVYDLDAGFGRPTKRCWFSPNLRLPFAVSQATQQVEIADKSVKTLEDLVRWLVSELGHDWDVVQKVTVDQRTS
ncbi:MAG: type I-E CRISPR-associated protein Cas7/Cse4/CasC [Fimbriimonadales bacterium]